MNAFYQPLKSFLYFLLFMIPAMSQAHVGGHEGNGGDRDSIEFTRVAGRILSNLRERAEMKPYFKRLEKALAEVDVESTRQKLHLKGIPKDAINYPDTKRIIFNRDSWSGLDRIERPRLVLHEYLGVAGVDDGSFEVSNRILGNYVDVEYAYASDVSVLAATKIFPDIFDQGKGGSAVLRAIESATDKRTRNDRMLTIGIPGTSDMVPFLVDTYMDEITEVVLEGMYIVIRGKYVDIYNEVDSNVVLRVKIKNDPQSVEYLENPEVDRTARR